MLRTFTAAALALSLIAGPVFAQGTAPITSAPMTQPAKIHVKHVKHANHVKPVKHVKHVAHAKHAKHIKHVKRGKLPTEKTRG